MRPQPLICVSDVEASSRWYQRLLGCESGHGGPDYERLVDSGRLIMQLHRWEEEHHHGAIGDPNDKPPGNGVLLWFEVDDIDAAIARAEALGPRLLCRVIGIRRMGMVGRIIGRFGCEIRMGIRWCSRVRMGRPMGIGGRKILGMAVGSIE